MKIRTETTYVAEEPVATRHPDSVSLHEIDMEGGYSVFFRSDHLPKLRQLVFHLECLEEEERRARDRYEQAQYEAECDGDRDASTPTRPVGEEVSS